MLESDLHLLAMCRNLVVKKEQSKWDSDAAKAIKRRNTNHLDVESMKVYDVKDAEKGTPCDPLLVDTEADGSIQS